MAKFRKRIFSSRKYSPQWNGPIEGYVVNFMKRNQWRVQSHMEYEDCIQEAYYIFLRLKHKYGRLDTPQHFMALYKTTLTNEFNDLVAKSVKYRVEVLENKLDGYYDMLIDTVAGDSNNDGELSIMMEQAPGEIKLVLQLMLTAPVEVLEMFAGSWKQRGKTKEFGNAHLCEILGLPKKTNIIDAFTDYFNSK